MNYTLTCVPPSVAADSSEHCSLVLAPEMRTQKADLQEGGYNVVSEKGCTYTLRQDIYSDNCAASLYWKFSLALESCTCSHHLLCLDDESFISHFYFIFLTFKYVSV